MASNDRYAGMGGDLLAPADMASAVVPNDNAPLPIASKRLWIGGAGAVKVLTVGGTTVTYAAPAGVYLLVRATQVFATGTTATNIVAES